MFDPSEYDVEDRMLPCPNPNCTNILKIRVYICKETQRDNTFFTKGSVRFVEALHVADFAAFRSGGCLGYSRPRQGPGAGRRLLRDPIWRMGPVTFYHNFVICRRCFRRAGWKRFKKENV